MRSLFAAATLALAIGLVAPAFSQSLTPDELTAKGEVGKSDPKSDPKPAGTGDAKPAKAAKGGKAAKKDTKKDAKNDASNDVKPAVIPPSVGINQLPPPGGRNVTATGKTMPPASGRGGAAPVKASTEVEMLKAQKAAEERNKAWDAKMRRTMSTICNGC